MSRENGSRNSDATVLSEVSSGEQHDCGKVLGALTMCSASRQLPERSRSGPSVLARSPPRIVQLLQHRAHTGRGQAMVRLFRWGP